MELNEIEKKNYNTWLVKINLDNIKANYDTIKQHGKEMLKLNDEELRTFLKGQFSYNDRIIWKYVDLKSIRELIADTLE